MQDYNLVSGDGGSTLRVTIKDQSGALVDLTGKSVQIRYAINGGAVQQRTMTALNQTSNKGQAEYQFLVGDLTAGGELKGEVRLQDGLSDQLTTVDTFHLGVKTPMGGAASSSPSASSNLIVSVNVLGFGADATGVTDSSAAIQSAITYAAANKIGRVYIPSGTYKILSPLDPKSDVLIYGDGYDVSTDGAFSLMSGTVLVGDGTAPCFAYNATDLGSDYASLATALAACRSGVRIHDLAMSTFSYGIKAGALYATGWFESEFRNLLATNCTKWGYWFENCSNSTFVQLKASLNGTVNDGTTGQMAFGASTVRYNHGNSHCHQLWAVSSRDGAKNIHQFARAGATFNGHNLYQCEGNTSSAKVSQSSTMSNGSANITVTDGTKFPVDMPVNFSSAANGFAQYQVYFVVSRVGNVIQVANKMGGSAISASGSAAITIERYGFPMLSIVGYDGPASTIQPTIATGLDLEGKGTCQLFIQNAYVHLDINYLNGGQGTNNTAPLVARNTLGTWRASQPVSYDCENSEIGFYSLGCTLRTGDTLPIVQKPPLGFYIDKNSVPSFNLGTGHNGKNTTLQMQFGSNGALIEQVLMPSVSVGQRCKFTSSTGFTLDAGWSGCLVFTGSSGGTLTLPALANAGHQYVSTTGMVFEICNGSTSAVTLVVAANTGNNFNRQVAKTIYSLPQGASLSVRANYDGTNGFWQVIGNNGAS